MPRGRIRWGAAVLVAAALCLAPAPASAGSPRVAALQAALKAKGLYTAEVDGVPGPMTRAATMRFQRRKRLTVDGVAGPQTRRALGSRGRPRARQPRGSSSRTWAGTWRHAVPALARRASRPARIDGGFGPGTARAVYAYQRSTGLGADGTGGHPDDPRAAPRPRRPSRLARALLQAARGADGRRLRPHRRAPPHGHRLPGARRHARKAAGRGVVSFAGWNTGGYGNLVVVKHRLGFASWYAHLGAWWPGPVRP